MTSLNFILRALRLSVLSVFLLNIFAFTVGADEFDTDEDGMPDAWETSYGLTVGVDDSGDDLDGDGLTNLEEYSYGTNPALADTDGDGRSDGDEVAVETDPLVSETADMDILDIYMDPATGMISYVATNLGNLDVDYTIDYGYTSVTLNYGAADETLYYYDWNTEMDDGSWVGTFFTAGGSETIDSGVALSFGEHSVMVCIDRAANHGEMAFGMDNCEIETFQVGPDLVIDSVSFNEDTSVSFVVRNAGTADVESTDFPQFNFVFDFFNADLSDPVTVGYLIDSFGMDYRTAGGSTTIVAELGVDSEDFPGCALYVLGFVDPYEQVTESNESNNEYLTTLDRCPEALTVEAGVDEGIGLGNVYTLDAYAEGATALTSATVDWGDSSAVESLTQTADGSRFNLTASHLYDHTDTFMVTVCASDGFETVCDSLNLSITGSSSSSSSNGGSGVTMPSNSDEEEVALTEEEDQEVVLSDDEDVDDCSAMIFADVSSEDSFYTAVCELWAADILHGKTANFFDTEDVIRRDEAAKIFTRWFGYVTDVYGETPVATEGLYMDVDYTDPLAYYIEVADAEGIVTSDSDSVEDENGDVVTEAYFMPHDAITAQEIADALKEILGDNEGGEELDEQGYEMEDTMTRGSFVEFLYGLTR